MEFAQLGVPFHGETAGILRLFPFVTVLILLGLGTTLGCGRVEKRFPGGDPYPIAAELEGAAGTTPQGILDEEERPARRVILPRNAREVDGLVLTTVLPSDQHTAGSPLRVRLLVRNTTRQTARLSYNTPQRFDLFVFPTEQSNNPIYVWSEHQYFPRDFQEHPLGAGAVMPRILEIPTTANPTVRALAGDDLGAPLTPGVYYLWSTHEGNPFLAEGPIRIEIIDPNVATGDDTDRSGD